MRLWPVALSCALLFSASVPAEPRRIADASNAYSFEFPSGWSRIGQEYVVTSASGASLVESDVPPQKDMSLAQISKTAGMMALIAADYAETPERFPLFGNRWQGLVTVFIEPRRAGRASRYVLQLVCQHDQSFRLFYLAIPNQLWRHQRDRYLALLSGLQFH